MENISIIMRSHNDIDFIEKTLKMLYSQTILNFELINMDNASTDGTLEVIKRYNKSGKFMNIEADRYIPGAVLNKAITIARGYIIVFLNSDAAPKNEKWLESLIGGLNEKEKIVATYSRQIARENANSLVRLDYKRAYPAKGGKSKLTELMFSFVSSAIYKTVLERFKIYEKGYSEDIEWCTRIVKNGYTYKYAPESIVFHSHNYNLGELFQRSYILGAALPYYDNRNSLLLLFILLRRCAVSLLRDSISCIKLINIKTLAYAPIYRLIIFIGHIAGLLGHK